MKNLTALLNRYVVPPLTALSENTYLSAIRAGMVSIVPLTIIGGLFMVACFFPVAWSSGTLATQEIKAPASLAAQLKQPTNAVARFIGDQLSADFRAARFPSSAVEREASRLRGSRVLTTDQWADYLLYRLPCRAGLADYIELRMPLQQRFQAQTYHFVVIYQNNSLFCHGEYFSPSCP